MRSRKLPYDERRRSPAARSQHEARGRGPDISGASVGNNHAESRFFEVVESLARTAREHLAAMHQISQQLAVKKRRNDKERDELQRKPAALAQIEAEIRSLESALLADQAQTGPGSTWQKTKDDLRQDLAHCESCILNAQSAVDSKTVEIKGRSYVADEHLKTLRSNEKAMYQKVVGKHPYHALLLQWTIGDPDEFKRLRLEHEIAEVEREYTTQTEARHKALDALVTKRRDLLQQLADHDAAAIAIARERERLERLLAERRADLGHGEEAHRAHLASKLAELADIDAENSAKTTASLESQRVEGEQRLNAAVWSVGQAVLSIHRHQPPFADMRATDLSLPAEHPQEFCLGWFLTRGKPSWECLFPSTDPFPLPNAIWLSADDEDSRTRVQCLLLRLMTALPPNGLTVGVIDPLQLGASLGGLRRLIDRPGPFHSREVCTLADEIEALLEAENNRLEELIQVTLRDGTDTWRDYNVKYPRTPLQYRVVVYYDAPEQLTDKSVVFLQRLVELGPARGILPIILLGDKAADDRRGAPLAKTLSAVPYFFPREHFAEDTTDVRDLFRDAAECHVVPDTLPPRAAYDQILDEVSDAYAAVMNKSPAIEELWGKNDFWQHSAAEGLIIPIGWSRDGAPVSLELGRPGGTGIHTLVAGRPGAGKSSLLHVLLHSLCHRYSPAEVRVMLLDYKQGVEMAMYASPVLPHADLVAIDSDVSYGVTVLEHLRDEIDRRSKIFQAAKKTSLDQFNHRRDPAERLPRILLLIDEFQVLFAEDRATTVDVEALLISLLRQGRAYGIHVLLCTQTLSGLTNISLTQLTALIAERICLACDAQDSAKTLASGNEAGSRLAGPPEAILNSANGSKEANRLFIFPEPVVSACQQHLTELAEKAAERGHPTQSQIFRGDEAVAIPEAEFFDATIGAHPVPAAIVGQALSFQAGPVVVDMPLRPGGHLLLTGPTPAVREGILIAALRSLGCNRKPMEVVVYNVRDNPRWQTSTAHMPNTSRISCLPVEWNGDLSVLPELPPGSIGVFIIDGMDQDRLLKPAASRPRLGESSPPAGISLGEFMSTAHKKGWRVIGTADNWRRLDTPERKDLLNEFQIRIGYQMSDDDASRMAFHAARAFGISGVRDRALFHDQHANATIRFRPFVLGR